MYIFIQVMAVTRINICKNGMMSLSRSVLMMYYTSVFIYFWIFSTPVVSLIFGSYLYICINWFHIHFDEAFSSLRIANYKSFTRFHIKKDGNLEIFTLAVDKVTIQLDCVDLIHLELEFQNPLIHITQIYKCQYMFVYTETKYIYYPSLNTPIW